MKRDVRVYLDDILESIELIQKYTANVTEEEFRKSVDIQDAVIRRLEIIGEAVKHIPDEMRKKYAVMCRGRKLQEQEIFSSMSILAYD